MLKIHPSFYSKRKWPWTYIQIRLQQIALWDKIKVVIFLDNFNVDGGDSFENLQGGIMFFLEMNGEEWKN